MLSIFSGEISICSNFVSFGWIFQLYSETARQTKFYQIIYFSSQIDNRHGLSHVHNFIAVDY